MDWNDRCPVCSGNIQGVPLWRSLSSLARECLMTLAEFKDGVASGFLTDRDGNGCWATDKAYIINSRVFSYYGYMCTPPPTITHVVWFNK